MSIILGKESARYGVTGGVSARGERTRRTAASRTSSSASPGSAWTLPGIDCTQCTGIS